MNKNNKEKALAAAHKHFKAQERLVALLPENLGEYLCWGGSTLLIRKVSFKKVLDQITLLSKIEGLTYDCFFVDGGVHIYFALTAAPGVAVALSTNENVAEVVQLLTALNK